MDTLTSQCGHPTAVFSIRVVAVDVLRLPLYLRHGGSL